MTLATGIVRTDVERAAAGDELAFGRLVAAHDRSMSKVAYLVTGDTGLAQDAVQAAWVIAWQKLPSLRDHDRVGGWLVTIAANEARQVMRRRRRVPVVTIEQVEAWAGAPDPGRGIARMDLERALSGLSADDRALLALRYVAGLDAAELGGLTGRSASGVRARLSRLTARLRQELGDD